MFSPTTLTFSVLALVLGDRPLRTGFWFYLGAFTATLAVGIVASFFIGDLAASDTSTPKTWVAVLDLILGAIALVYVVVFLRRPPDPARAQSMIEKMGKLATAPVLAIVGAGAALANPGGFIPIALKDISELNPSTTQYAVDWLFFTVASLLPLGLALLSLLVARDWTVRQLGRARTFLERDARSIAAAIVVLLAASLIRNGVAGLTG
jgi:hypothetical protein